MNSIVKLKARYNILLQIIFCFSLLQGRIWKKVSSLLKKKTSKTKNNNKKTSNNKKTPKPWLQHLQNSCLNLLANADYRTAYYYMSLLLF